MAIQNLSGIESMLQQMRAAVRASQAGELSAIHREPSSVQGGFAAELQRSIRKISDAQNASQAQARAFELGAADVSLNDVMIDIQKASLAFQGAVQVRNKLVSAYQEIANMAV